MTRPSRVRNARIRLLLKGGTAAWLQDRSPGLVFYSWRVGAWSCRHWRVTAPALVFWFLWGSVGFATAVLLFGVLAALACAAWVRWRAPKAPDGIAKASVEDAKAKATLRRQWPDACNSARLVVPKTGEAPRLAKVTGNGHGTLTARLESPKTGLPVAQVMKAAPALADVVGCREVVVTEKTHGVAELVFHWKDPIGRLVTLADLPLAPPGRLAYGVRQDAACASINATESILIGGLTRHGKSNFVRALLGDALRQGVYIDLYISDPKNGVQFSAFGKNVRGQAVGPGEPRRQLEVIEYAKNPADTLKMLERVEKRMNARGYHMEQAGTSQVAPTEENPLVVVILDELLPFAPLLKKGVDTPLGRIAYTGAAAAFVIWANAQVGQKETLGPVRDLFPQRVCFATGNRATADAVLGDGAESEGAECSRITERGVGYSHSEGDRTYKKFRAALVEDEEAWGIAESRLPPKVVNAAREAYDRKAELSTASKSRKDRRTALYRWYYIDHAEYGNSLGYVGISYDVVKRESQHSAALREFMEGNVRREVVYYDTRPEAEAAEKLAIQLEKPIHNVVHNGGSKRRWDRKKVAA